MKIKPVPPCAGCGTTGGSCDPGQDRPRRRKGKPFGIEGMLCHKCYYMHYSRIKLAKKGAAPPEAPSSKKLTPEQSRLVADNQGLVWSIALKYQGRGLEARDLAGWGQFGLIYAAQSYDPDRGAAFSTWATLAIKGAIYRAFRDWSRTVRLPQNIHTELAKGADRAQFPRAYSEHELGWSLASIPEDRDTDLPDNREAVEKAVAGLSALPARSADVLRLRFGIGGEARTLREIAIGLGVSKERVRQIETEALKTLRKQVGGAA